MKEATHPDSGLKAHRDEVQLLRDGMLPVLRALSERLDQDGEMDAQLDEVQETLEAMDRRLSAGIRIKLTGDDKKKLAAKK